MAATPPQRVGAGNHELLALGLDDLLAAVIAARADMVAQMRFPGGRLDSQRRIGQEVMGAVHATLRRRLLVLLDSHVVLLKNVFEKTSCT